ncbi:MAG: DUF4097 family beta strand repeat-containing protein [Terriglobales bacterium]
MASPVQTPRPRVRHSYAGPIVLIIIGIEFLMGTMGMLDMADFGHWFAHYWPVLLILWGVIKLVEYQQAQREGARYPGIGVGGVFLLIVLIGFGIAATQASRVDWDALGNHGDWPNDDFFQNMHIFGPTYTFTDEMTQSFPASANLHVTSSRGNVSVQDSGDNQIKISISKKLHAHNQNEADKYNLSTKPKLNVSGNLVTLDANTQGSGDRGVVTDMTISLPRKASVVISTRHGDVSVSGRDGDADITNSHGDVSATDIHGKVTLDIDQGSAQLSKITSDVSIRGHANDVSLDDIAGSVRLDGEFMESVKLSKIAKPVTFKSPRTDIEFSRLDGDLNLDSGDLQAANITGPLRLTTRSKDIRLDGMTGDVRLQNENGTVEIHVSKLGSMQVDDRQGDIQIYLPDKAGFQVDAIARNGEVQSDFSDLKIVNGDDQATASGNVGGGGPHLVLNDEHGAIQIHKASSATERPEQAERPEQPERPAAPETSGRSARRLPKTSRTQIPQPTDN